ncbi:MAG: hypothetical protein CL945_03725 [Dinoroseobacter sp.]|jgi:hypothetical protein|uniref:hypothetical protein n=1 Tax=Alterinioella nitratireducens TaxID=2735915 RepID=UPI000C5F6CCE|nr:hypothetical protein [Alterinioella nitratireducens]MAN13806.1 hypothetical protein [Dinoroseobacter sp.]MAX73369.1 hypothetical protein [Nioella sp.]NPD18236.1 hypothetical protein [Alterinioella nitratireducens]
MSRRLFLERRTYRRNRLQDAARLAPVLAMFLFFGPVFILTSNTGISGETGGWLVYFLGVWAGLVVLSGVLSGALARAFPDEGPDADGGD